MDCQNDRRNMKLGDRRTPYSLGSTRSKYQPSAVNLSSARRGASLLSCGCRVDVVWMWCTKRTSMLLAYCLQAKGRTISRHIMARTDMKEQFLTLHSWRNALRISLSHSPGLCTKDQAIWVTWGTCCKPIKCKVSESLKFLHCKAATSQTVGVCAKTLP